MGPNTMNNNFTRIIEYSLVSRPHKSTVAFVQEKRANNSTSPIH